jgi:uncharacterized repeat protein (TIGR01451 family)
VKRTPYGLLLAGTATLCATGTAQAQTAAQTTTAGTTVSNTASVSYSVNGQTQTTNSTTASFVVDRKVNFTVVTDQTGATQVNLNQTGAYTSYKVTNTTNGTQDFLLNAFQTGIIGGLLTGTDDFDLTNVKIYVDSNKNGVYDPGVDTATFIDELAPDASIEVFIVGDIPSNATINQANVALQVIAAAGGAGGTQGTALVATDLNVGNADNLVDVVFADGDSDGLGVDIGRNGQGWAYASYAIGTRNVALTVAKTALILSDGVNAGNPKAIPGAVVQYCMLANNATLTAAANGVVITDPIPANTTYVAGSLAIGLPGGTCTLLPTITAPFSGSFDTPTNAIIANIGTVNGGATVAVSFRVTIN